MNDARQPATTVAPTRGFVRGALALDHLRAASGRLEASTERLCLASRALHHAAIDLVGAVAELIQRVDRAPHHAPPCPPNTPER